MQELNFLRTGDYHYSYGYPTNCFINGLWWSNTSVSASYGRNLGAYPGNVDLQNYSYRGHGFAIRCVIRER